MANAWVAAKKSSGIARRHDCIALVLQGGGALGAYQAGVYEELSRSAYQLDWIAGVSIGTLGRFRSDQRQKSAPVHGRG